MTVKAIKLVTGEEIMGEVESETSTHITLENPVQVALQPTRTGEMGLSFLPFMPYLGKVKYDIPLDKTILVKEVDEQMKNQYNSVFGGIVVPPKTLITG